MLDCQAVANGTRFGLAVADDASHDEAWIVERGAEGVAQRITEFAALVNGAGRGRRDMARNPARKRKLFEQPLHSGFVLADVGIDFAVAALEIGVGDQSRPAMAWTGDVDHVEIIEADRPIEMDVDEILPGVVPQCPTTSGLTCVSVRGSRSIGFA